ncbi:MAG: tetratricopeptide repeat protein, partial [Pseudomonadota bacterium]
GLARDPQPWQLQSGFQTSRRCWQGLKKRIKQFFLTLGLYVFLYPVGVDAQPLRFEDGIIASERGDFKTAFDIWSALGEKGDVRAQYNLGVMYSKGEGVERDDLKSYDWHLRAARKNFALSQYVLAIIYQQGLGVKADIQKSVKWMRLAAKQNFAPAQYNLGYMHFTGEGVQKSARKTLDWWSMAAAQGYAKAQSGLGMLYFTGDGGLAQDYVYAYMWWYVAASNGSQNAKKNLELLAPKMDISDVTTAEERGQRCIYHKKYIDC